MSQTHPIPIFKSTDPDAIAQAVSHLKSAGIPFRELTQPSGSVRVPRHVNWIVVDPQYEDQARHAIADIPTEIMLPSHHPPIDPAHRVITWILLIAIAVIVIVSLITRLLNN